MRRTWAYSAAIRAVKTMAQTAAAMISTAVVLSDVDWKYTISAAILAGILSVLTSLGGLPEVDDTKIYYRDKEDEIEVEEAKDDGGEG